jgi:hypothetical protein
MYCVFVCVGVLCVCVCVLVCVPFTGLPRFTGKLYALYR